MAIPGSHPLNRAALPLICDTVADFVNFKTAQRAFRLGVAEYGVALVVKVLGCIDAVEALRSSLEAFGIPPAALCPLSALLRLGRQTALPETNFQLCLSRHKVILSPHYHGA